MRRRNVKSGEEEPEISDIAATVKSLDAFPKIPENYKETSASRGGVSIVVFIVASILVYSEIKYFSNSKFVFRYDIDPDYEQKLDINVDITVAMRCAHVGGDVLDLTGTNAHAFGHLNEEDTHFELSKQQRHWFDMMKNVNSYLKNEYHAVQEFLWQTGYSSSGHGMPKREIELDTPKDACRFHGTLTVNKVAGNFHITAGKALHTPGGHMHLAGMMSPKDYNFSHRIDEFSFGRKSPGIVNPMDGEERIADGGYHMFQYFVKVVPTKVNTDAANLDTFQYAVTDRNRSINHSQGSHGVPGIFVKYDLSPMKVFVTQEYKPIWKFLVRLCAMVGGLIATSGMLHSCMEFMVDCVCCKFRFGKYSSALPTRQSQVSPAGDSKPSMLLKPERGVSLISPD